MAGRKQSDPEVCNVIVTLKGRALDIVMYEKKRYDDNKKPISKNTIINRFLIGARLNAAPWQHKKKNIKVLVTLTGEALMIVNKSGKRKDAAILLLLNSI